MPVSTRIQLRRDTAANWTSANPIIARGELAWETDTNKLKIGDGATTWVSLGYGGPIGPTQTDVIESYGDGSDGDVTISSGTTTLVKDMFYNNLTLSGTGILRTVGYKVFIAGIFDITAAAARAINFDGLNGGNGAASTTGGTAGAVTAGVTVGGSLVGGVGGAGGTAGGTQAAAASAAANANGGSSGAGGAGGSGLAGVNAGGIARAGITISGALPIHRFEDNLIKGVTLLISGAVAPGGSGGGGDATAAAGGGGSGSGPGVVGIWAKTINRGGSTAVGCISARPGTSGNGGSPAAGNRGGGGGAGGGGGGWVIIQYQTLTGSTATNAIDASGATGGNGGTGIGTGLGGNGGTGGNGGRIVLLNVATSSSTRIDNTITAGTTGGVAVGTAGGAGGAGVTTQLSI